MSTQSRALGDRYKALPRHEQENILALLGFVPAEFDVPDEDFYAITFRRICVGGLLTRLEEILNEHAKP